jgi:hypothetical protein
MAKPRPKRYRDATTGRLVSEVYAREHPDTTVAETVKKKT